jgi:hypothetical protein
LSWAMGFGEVRSVWRGMARPKSIARATPRPPQSARDPAKSRRACRSRGREDPPQARAVPPAASGRATPGGPCLCRAACRSSRSTRGWVAMSSGRRRGRTRAAARGDSGSGQSAARTGRRARERCRHAKPPRPHPRRIGTEWASLRNELLPGRATARVPRVHDGGMPKLLFQRRGWVA